MNEILLVNPRKRKRRAKRRTVSRRRKNPVRRRRRRNPNGLGTAQNLFMPALTGAGGALALDLALGYVPIPLAMKTGIPGYAVKAAAALGLGMLMDNFKMVRHATAVDMTKGALTVMLHGAIKQQMQIFMPQVPLGEYLDNGLGYVASGWPTGLETDDPLGTGMGTYLPDLSSESLMVDETGLGEYMTNNSYANELPGMAGYGNGY